MIEESDMISVATFNCENLFSRPKIFGAPKTKAAQLLKVVAELDAELKKDEFDQIRIRTLKKALSGYAKVNDIRRKHDRLKPGEGAKEWLGWIELTRRPADDIAIENTARVIADIDADVVALVEVENRPLLKQFHDDLLKREFFASNPARTYGHIMVIDGNDKRGIDVAIMSRFPITWMQSHVADQTTYLGRTINTFSRDCLEATIEIPGAKPLIVLANHFKSMGYSPPADRLSNIRRRGQAQRVADLVSARKLDEEFVIVAGDLNSDPKSVSLEPLVKHPKLYNVNLELKAGKRGTYRTGNKQLDYLFVSTALQGRLGEVKIERRGTFAKKKWKPYPSVTGRRSEASDHCAVVAQFDL
jgi:endonuclease/exonuclease/phosphatase family metal-dependent hydrolase